MPLSNPEVSFDVAVRHLFRHLNDAMALRRNPLVNSFFSGPPNHKADTVALAALRAQVLQFAAKCRTEDIAAGFKAQAIRGYEIVEAIILGEGTSKTAVDLGLSIRQYYRDRQAIGKRIARCLVDSSSTSVDRAEIDESLRLMLRRAVLLAEQGFAGKSVALLLSGHLKMYQAWAVESVPARA